VRNGRALVVVSAVAMMAGLFLPAVTSAASANSSGRVVLSGTKSQAAVRSASLGKVAANSEVDFALVLNPRDRAGAEALAKSVSDPGSASYRHYLNAAQWEARFSPTTDQVARAQKWLSQQGFAVSSVSADRLDIEASGTAAQVERAFGTGLSMHSVNGKTLRFADQDLSIPSDLAGIVAGAAGINQTVATPASAPIPQPPGFRVAHPCGDFYGQNHDAVQPPYGHGFPYPAPYAVCGYTPPQLREAYDLPSKRAGGLDGSGVTVAIIDAFASPTLLADGQQYASINDPSHPLLSSKFAELLAPKFDNEGLCDAPGWSGEQTLDVEAVHATAPGANILYVGAQNCLDSGLLKALHAVVDNGLANVITNSWGDTGGDLLNDAATKTAYDNTFLLAAGTGISVMFSSGDDGDEFATLGIAVPDYPASSPFVTDIGGTTLQIGKHGAHDGELGWSTGSSLLCNDVLLGSPGCTHAKLNTWLPVTTHGGSGGGTSYTYLQPFYQAGIVPTSMSERNSPIFGPVPTRVVPDISMDADPSTGFLVGETQKFVQGTHYAQYRIGGTSVSSPLFAGVVALADQGAHAPAGFLNPALYKIHTKTPAAILDIVPGGKQSLSRVDYANSVSPKFGFIYSTRVITYTGLEEYCDGGGNCAVRNDVISTRQGYDDMTGLGAPTTGFVQALART
jgi:subtilase family serine protease